MVTTFIRTIIIYFFLIISMRLMGKRQIGELQPSELVTALLLSELAAQPVADSNIPLLSAILPILLLLCLEVALSYLVVHSRLGKRLFWGVPSVLIANGTLRQKALERARISPEELLSQLRQNGVGNIDEVAYAIMEEHGKVSVIEKASCASLKPKDMSVNVSENGILHPLIVQGCFSFGNMQHLQYSKKDILRILRSKGIEDHRIVYLLAVNDSGDIFLAKNETKEEDSP